MGLYSGGLIIERIFASEVWGAYFQEGLLFLSFFVLGGGGLVLEFHGILLKRLLRRLGLLSIYRPAIWQQRRGFSY